MPAIVCLPGLGRSVHDWDAVREGLGRYGGVRPIELPAELPAPAILVGHSMAGVVALRRAAAEPERVVGVILTGGFFPPARNGRTTAAALRDYGSHRIAVARELAARRGRPRPSGAGARGLGSLARLGLRPSAFHAIANQVRAPVLVVHARDDHYVPVDFALAAASRHPLWPVRVVDAGGHNVHVDRPDDWLAATGPWLDGLLGP